MSTYAQPWTASGDGATVSEYVASLTTTSLETESSWIVRAMLEPGVLPIVGRITTDGLVALADHLAVYATQRVSRTHSIGLDLGVSLGKGLEVARAQEEAKRARKKAKH